MVRVSDLSVPARQVARAPGPALRKAPVGLTGIGMTTPDNAAYTIGAAAGNGIVVDLHLRMKQWSAIGTTHWWAAQGDHIFSTDLTWAASLHPNGCPRFALTADGSTVFGTESTVPLPFKPGQEGWVRQGYSNFFGLGLMIYFYSYDGVNWTQLGDTLNLGAYVQPKDSAQPIRVPGQFAEPGQEQVTFEMRVSVSGTMVTNPRFDTIGTRASSFRDDQGRTWSTFGDGLIGVV